MKRNIVMTMFILFCLAFALAACRVQALQLDLLAPGDFPWEDTMPWYMAEVMYKLSGLYEAVIHVLYGA